MTMSRRQWVPETQSHGGSVGYILELSHQGTWKLGYSWRNHGDLFKAIADFIIVSCMLPSICPGKGNKEKLLCIVPLGFLCVPFVLWLGCHHAAYYAHT